MAPRYRNFCYNLLKNNAKDTNFLQTIDVISSYCK